MRTSPLRLLMVAGLSCVLAAFGMPATTTTAHAEPPNVLLIVVDDLNTDVGFMDGGAHTPNLDALAARGVVFSDAHCNAPVCNPSRTSFLTGRLPASTGVLDNDTYFRRVDGGPGVLTIPEYFRRHGYRSIGAGKVFHSGHRPASHPHAKLLDRNRSWDEYAELSIGTPLPKPRPNKWHEGRVQTWMKNAFWWAAIDADDDETGDFQNAHFAADVLRREHDQPFFLAYGVYRPHLPFVTPRKYFDRYPLSTIDWPAAVHPGDTDDLPREGKKFARKTAVHNALLVDDQWKEALRAYRASTTFADAAAGVVLDALFDGPHRDNTIVVFTSDHGFHLGSKNHWAKFTLWDRSTRVPMVVWKPGMAPGVSTQTVSLVDLFPTLTDLAGLPGLEQFDGTSFAPLLDDPDADHGGHARVVQDSLDHAAVIDEHFRYIRYADGGEELYDRRADPHDWHNLASDPNHLETLKKYRVLMDAPVGSSGVR